MPAAPDNSSASDLVEPFAWMSNPKQVGRYRGTALATPRQEMMWGLFLILAAGVFVAMLVGRGSTAVVLAVLVALIFGGLGATLLIMARARARWARAYRKLHGRSPFLGR